MIKITEISNRLDKEKIVVLVDGWLSFESLYFLMRESLPKEFGYIQYAYPDKMLCPDPLKTKENILHLINTIVKDLNKLKRKKPRSFYLYGQSLGGLFCMIVSDKIKTEKVMLIVPGCNLAESFWQGESTQELKNKMVSKYKVTLPQLKKYWKEISPDYYFKKKSHETEFSLVLSRVDKVIPISNGKKLLKLLKEDNIKYTKSWTNLSHKFEILEEGIFMSHFKKWIKSIK
jgi:esterase/lipase